VSLGLCVHPKRLPPQADLDALRPAFLRSILYGPEDLDRLLATGLPLFITLNNEYRGGWSAFDDACRLIADNARGRMLGVGCGNELSGYWGANEHDVPPAFGADLIRRASAILRPAGIPVYTDSVTGPRWVEYLTRLLALADEHIDGIATQATYGRAPDGWGPPGWGFGSFRDMIGTIRSLTAKPIMASEAGVKIGEAGGEDGQATYLTALDATCRDLDVAAAYFCYEDSQGKPDERGSSAFGLVADDGRRRPAFHAYAALHPPLEAPVVDYRAYAREAAVRATIPPELFERQIQQESGFDPNAYNAGSGATGIAQIIARFHPNVDPRDPIASLDYAARWMAALYRQYGSYRKALAAYNWGPGNVSSWDGSRAGLPAETRHYLDVILGAGWPEPGAAGAVAMKLSEVLERARSRIGDPYVWGGKKPPSTDCSGFVAWAYDGKVRSYTDHILPDTERVDGKDIAPGDIVLYEYDDPNQPDTRFPHVGLFISDTVTLDNRFGHGVGEHPQLPRSQARRFYRRLPGVIVDTDGSAPVPAPVPDDPRDAEIAALKAQLDDARSRLGVASVDYVKGLRDLADALEALKP
jgi:soluble lytic murein transglycosylase-like protein